MYRFQSRSGFSLLELVLVISVLTIILMLTLIISTRAIGRGNIHASLSIIVQVIRRAQVSAQNNVSGTPWGVYLCPTPGSSPDCIGLTEPTVILFSRSNSTYGSLQPADQQYALPTEVSITGTLFDQSVLPPYPGLVFSKIDGMPNISGTIILTQSGDSRTITVSSHGVVEY